MVPVPGPVPLFGPVPGGAEILVIILIALVLFGLPVVLIASGLYLYRQSQTDKSATEEIEALRREVELLREEIESRDDKK